MTPQVASFFDPQTGTVTYVVYELPGTECAIVDSVLDYDPKAGRTTTASADRVIEFVKAQDMKVQWLLETHAHADHLSAAQYLRQHLGGAIAIGENIRTVQRVFDGVFNLGDLRLDGSQFDHLFSPDEVFRIGRLRAVALHVPGHTPADMAYLVEDQLAFVGDTLFMPDVGTARCDFPGGSAHAMYQSVQKLLSLPDQVRLFMCHDYPPDHRAPAWETTVGEQKRKNIHVHEGIDEDAFIKMRRQRDTTLEMPTLILPSIQVNIRAGQLPSAENNGIRYLKIPLNAL